MNELIHHYKVSFFICREEVDRLARECRMRLYRVSVKEDINVGGLFQHLAENYVNKLRSSPPPTSCSSSSYDSVDSVGGGQGLFVLQQQLFVYIGQWIINFMFVYFFRLWSHEPTNPNWRTCSYSSSITYQHWKHRVEQLGSQFDQPLFHFSSGLFSQSYVRQSERYPETPALLAKQWQNHFPQTSRCQKNSQFTT